MEGEACSPRGQRDRSVVIPAVMPVVIPAVIMMPVAIAVATIGFNDQGLVDVYHRRHGRDLRRGRRDLRLGRGREASEAGERQTKNEECFHGAEVITRTKLGRFSQLW